VLSGPNQLFSRKGRISHLYMLAALFRYE